MAGGPLLSFWVMHPRKVAAGAMKCKDDPLDAGKHGALPYLSASERS